VPRHSRIAAAAAALAVGLALLTGCASAPTAGPPASSSVSAPGPTENPYGGAPVDAPGPGEPVLVVTPRKGAPTTLTLDQLAALGTRTISVDEPFVKARQTFTGVPVAAVLAAAGVPAAAELRTVALNDYRYDDSAADLIASDALVATQRDGAAIPFDQGGPIRLVFPDGTPLAANLDAWNWSLAEIRVI
jgi:hypothetical protein